jgi:hypothetical protein
MTARAARTCAPIRASSVGRSISASVPLDPETDPAAEPEDVEVDEHHRSSERRDLIRDPVLHALGMLLGVLDERGVRLQWEV